METLLHVLVALIPPALATAPAIIHHFLGKRSRRETIRANLDDRAYRRAYAADLRRRSPGFRVPGIGRWNEEDYRAGLRSWLDWLSHPARLGPDLLGRRAFVVLACLAICYGNVLLVGGWLLCLGASTESIDVLPAHWPWWQRGVLGLILLAIAAGSALLFGCIVRPGSALRRGTLFVALAVLTYGLILVAQRFTAGDFRLFRPDMDQYSFAILLLGLVASYVGCIAVGFRRRLGTWTMVGLTLGLAAIVCLSALVDGYNSGHDLYAVLLVLILPGINAVFDTLSLAVTRRLLRDLAEAPATFLRLLAHVTIDLLAAVLLLFTLAVTLAIVISSANLGVSTDAIIDEVRREPFGSGLWLVVMVGSTLLPTAIHLTMILGNAVFLPTWTRTARGWAEVLEGRHKPQRPVLDEIADYLVGREVWRYLVGGLLLGVIWIAYCFGLPVASRGVADVALQAGRWVRPADAHIHESLVLASRATVRGVAGDHAAALELADRAAELNPGDHVVRYTRGLALHDVRRFVEALSEYRTAAGIDERQPLYHAAVGNVLLDLERYDEAIEAYDRAIELAPRRAHYHGFRSVCLELAGDRLDEAIESARAAVDLAPRDPYWHGQLAWVLVLDGQDDEAFAVTDRILALDRRNALGHRIRSILHWRAERWDEGIAALRIACDFQPTASSWHVDLAGLLSQRDRHIEAAIVLEGLIHREPYESRPLLELADVYMELDRPEDALRILERAEAMDPASGRVLMQRSRTLEELGRIDEAMAALRRWAELPGDPPGEVGLSYSRLGAALARHDRLVEADRAYRRAIEANPSDSSVLAGHGEVLARLGRWHEAEAAFGRAADRMANIGVYRLEHAEALLRIGRPEDALRALDAVNSFSGWKQASRRLRAEALLALDRPDEALESIEAVTAEPVGADSSARASAHLVEARILVRLDRFEDALAAIDRALELEPAAIDLRHARGLVLLRLGRRAEAGADLVSALREAPLLPGASLLDRTAVTGTVGEH